MLKALLFDGLAYLDMMEYTHQAGHNEICGIGRVETDQFDIQHVTEIRILPQIVSGGDVNVSHEEYDKFLEGIPEEQHKEWCFNWHSHVNMQCHPSGTDTTNYDNWIDAMDQLIAFITNKRYEYYGAVYKATPIYGKYEIDNIWPYELRERLQAHPVSVTRQCHGSYFKYWYEACFGEYPEERRANIIKEIEEKVTERRTQYNTRYYSGGLAKAEEGKNLITPRGTNMRQDYSNTGRNGTNTSNSTTDTMDQAGKKNEANPGSKNQGEERGIIYNRHGNIKQNYRQVFSQKQCQLLESMADKGLVIPSYNDVEALADTMDLFWDSKDNTYWSRGYAEEYSFEELAVLLIISSNPELKLVECENLEEIHDEMALSYKMTDKPVKADMLPIKCENATEAFQLQNQCACNTKVSFRNDGVWVDVLESETLQQSIETMEDPEQVTDVA